MISCSKSMTFLRYTADNFRPYLTSFQGNAFTDYINAVFVDVSICLYLPYTCKTRMYVHCSTLENFIKIF